MIAPTLAGVFKMKRTFPGLLAAILLAVASPGFAQDAIGEVSRLQGEANSANVALELGSSVFLNQEVSTGDAARLEMTFLDGTQLTLGEKATMILDTFVYNPAAGTGKLKMAVKGAFRFISGQVSKQPDKEVAVTTPVATVGIRGTEFWGGPIDNQVLGVFLIEGEVSVTNPQGEQVLDTPGEGTNISTPDAAPGPVTIWPQDKVQRALATVTFQ
jgi:hypothetical protein